MGGFCPITCKLKDSPDFALKKGDAIENFYCYLSVNINKNVNSMRVIDNLSEIYRTLYNYCDIKDERSTAMALGLTDKVYLPEQLLEEAIKQLTGK